MGVVTLARRIGRARTRDAQAERKATRRAHRLVSVAVRKGDLAAAQRHFQAAPARYRAAFWLVRFVAQLGRPSCTLDTILKRR